MHTLDLVWHRAPGDPLPADWDIDENRVDLLADGDSIGYVNLVDCKRYMWVEYIAVKTPRQGHGTRLLAAVLEAFPGRIFALSASEPLVQWYEKFGFVPGHMNDEDCLVRPAHVRAREP